ncbi:uncharacterized protein METZ01_LOCUS283480, partial [marine metagenome]
SPVIFAFSLIAVPLAVPKVRPFLGCEKTIG